MKYDQQTHLGVSQTELRLFTIGSGFQRIMTERVLACWTAPNHWLLIHPNGIILLIPQQKQQNKIYKSHSKQIKTPPFVSFPVGQVQQTTLPLANPP